MHILWEKSGLVKVTVFTTELISNMFKLCFYLCS